MRSPRRRGAGVPGSSRCQDFTSDRARLFSAVDRFAPGFAWNKTMALSDPAVSRGAPAAFAVMADRTRTKYGDSIVPDEVITDPGEVAQRAIAWLVSGS